MENEIEKTALLDETAEQVSKKLVTQPAIVPRNPFQTDDTQVMAPGIGEGILPNTENADNDPQLKRETPKEKILRQIRDRQNRKYNDKWGFMDSIKGAGIGFLKAFAANQGLPFGQRLLAAVGGAGMGAVQGTVDPNTDEKWSNENKLANLHGLLDTETQIEADEAKQRKLEQEAIKSQFETEGVFLNNQGKELDNLRTANKPLYDSVMADDQITEDEAVMLRKAGYPVVPVDKRQFETTWVNGKPMTAPKLGVPIYARNPSLADKALEVPVTSTVGDDSFVSTSPQALTARVGVEQANANREAQAAQQQQKREDDIQEKEYKSKKEFEDDKRAWENRQRTAKASLAKSSTQITALQAARQKLITDGQAAGQANGYDTTEVDKQIGALQGEISAAQVLMGEKAPKMIVRPKNPNTSKGGKNNNIGTTDDYQRALQKVKNR